MVDQIFVLRFHATKRGQILHSNMMHDYNKLIDDPVNHRSEIVSLKNGVHV
jgi:hypothetical protein